MLHVVIGGHQAYKNKWLRPRAVSRLRFAPSFARNKSWGLKLKKVHKGKESSKKFEKDFCKNK